jgi:hypothetical protein
LICRSIKGETLVIFLIEVLDACDNVGLVVIATVFDMGANNVKALKLLGATMEAILQVSESRYCDSVCSPTSPELHQQSLPQKRGTV